VFEDNPRTSQGLISGFVSSLIRSGLRRGRELISSSTNMGARELLLAAALLHVSVAQEPTLTLMPSDKLLKALDGSVYVSCAANVEDPALITEMRWSGPNDEEIPNSDGSIITLDNPSSPGTLDLYVQKLKEKDVGTYKCTAVYAGNKQLAAEITVESYMDIDFGDTPLHQTPIEGTDSKIMCTVTANPQPMVDWLKDLKPIKLDDRTIIQQDGVLIKQITQDDEGVYRCRAKVPQLGSIEYKDIKVEVYSPPVIIEAPENITGVEKEQAVFKCEASGKPNPTYTWVDKDSRPLEDAEGYNVDVETGTLTVMELGPQHTGMYRCTASNDAGDLTKEAHLQVLTKPKIESYLNLTSNVEDENVEMRCVATGDPLPELVFKKESAEAAFVNGINEDGRIEIRQEIDDQGRAVGIMKISELSRSDDGLYTCTGNSAGGETQVWGHITAQFAPTFEEQTFTEVWTWDQKLINISCIATSIPNATVQWYLRNEEIQAEDANFQIMSAGPIGVLQVNPVDNSYFGVFTCQASNLLGTSDYDIELKQAEVPGAVSNVKPTKTTATTITWDIMDPMNDGGRPIEGYNMEYRLSEATWDEAQSQFWTKGSEYTVERLVPDSTYIFRFSAKNEVGFGIPGGEQAQMMPKRAAPEEPLIFDLNDGTYESPYPNHYTIQWHTPLDNGEPIDNFQIIHYQMKNNSGKLERTEDLTTIDVSSPGPTTYKLEDLMPNTIYKIELRAHNVIGYSQPAEGIIKTAHDPSAPVSGSDEESASVTSVAPPTTSIPAHGPIPDPSTQSIGVGIIIAIVIIAAIIIALVVDVSCYFANKSGVLAKILGSREPKDKDKEAMLEDGKNASGEVHEGNGQMKPAPTPEPVKQDLQPEPADDKAKVPEPEPTETTPMIQGGKDDKEAILMEEKKDEEDNLKKSGSKTSISKDAPA